MTEFRTVTKYIERKTYLKGRLRGKYFGYLDYGKSDLVHENFYSMEIMEAEVQVTDVKKWQEGGEFDEYRFVDFFPTKLPANTPFNIKNADDTAKYYYMDLRGVKVKGIRLMDPVYEGNKVFGTIEGDICGYVLRLEPIEVEIPVVSYIFEDLDKEKSTEGALNRTFDSSENISTFSHTKGTTFWETTGTILQSLLSILFLLPLIYIGWPFLLLIGISLLFQLIGQIIQPVLRYIGRPIIAIIWILSLYFACFSLFGYFSKSSEMVISPPKTQDLPQEKSKNEDIENQGIKDSIICHFRVWEDYSGGKYQGYLKIRQSDWLYSSNYHQNAFVQADGLEGYNQILQQFIGLDSSKLQGVYSLFDTLQVQHNLDKKAFAEMVVSCIQDIPYTLILDNICDPLHYDDQFIKEFLTKGGICHPFVKFGIFSPVEFAASLHGDCDTRSLLLYTILNHYGYEVAMLTSEAYRHAVLAIHLPYIGTSKYINGKRYVLWETTQAGIPPGVFPNQISNMNLWSFNLISTNNPLQ